MENKYLVLNAGSSSLKFSLYEMPEEILIAKGVVERIGLGSDSIYVIKTMNNKIKGNSLIKNHAEAVSIMMDNLIKNNIISNIEDIKAVGHRILHGSNIYKNSVIINDKVVSDIEDLSKLGPLHHPGELAGIRAISKIIPNAINIAVFDTSFHQTIPEEKFLYPVPYSWYKDYNVRKYGFHGTSHRYITEYMKEYLNRDNPNLIICHIGNGASISAIKDGKCYDTTMGLTPLDGLMMGTRSGSIDPSIVSYMAEVTNRSAEDIFYDLNYKSGLLGISEKSSDFRDVVDFANSNDKMAKIALHMYVDSTSKYIAEYYVNDLKGKVDGIIFTAGVGENAAIFRKMVIDNIKDALGISFNEEMNDKIAGFKEQNQGIITNTDSKVNIYVIPTNEELMIVRDTYNLVALKDKHRTI